MSAKLKPYPGGMIADPTTTAPIVWTTWTGVETTGFVLIANTSETGPVYLVTADDETASGRSVPPGGCASFGPYADGTPLWIVGADASPVHYSFDAIASEGR